jgi:glycosyltransferase involved in cell wall biosynthesis
MRLAVFTSQFPSLVNTFFARDLRGLLEAGWEVDVFTLYPLNADYWQYVPDILNDRCFPRNRVYHGDPYRDLFSIRPSSLRKSAIMLRDLAAVTTSAARFGVRAVVKSSYALLRGAVCSQHHPSRYDHVLAYWGNYAATCAYLYHRLTDCQVPFSMFLHAGTDLYREQVFLPQKLMYADNVIVVCEFNRHFIREKYPELFPHLSEKFHVHHLGLDLEEFTYQPDGRPDRRIIAVGRLEREKGFDVLLQAVSALAQRGLHVELELVGEGSAREALRMLADSLRILDRVTFRGWLAFDKVREAMKQATLLVHPSTGLGDAVPTVIKESMALGTPVVGSNAAGIPELLDHGRCGLLVPPRDSTALADAIQTMLVDHQRRREFADLGRRFAERQFNLWKNAERLSQRLCATTRAATPRLQAPM